MRVPHHTDHKAVSKRCEFDKDKARFDATLGKLAKAKPASGKPNAR